MFFFFFNDTATTEIYTLSLHDALPISPRHAEHDDHERRVGPPQCGEQQRSEEHTSELQSPCNLVCRLLLEKKKKNKNTLAPQNRVMLVDTTRATLYTYRTDHYIRPGAP